MKILPLAVGQQTTRYYQGMFLEGALPNPLAYSMQDLFNKALTTKWYLRSVVSSPAGTFTFNPQDRIPSNVCGATYPAQTSAVLSDGRRRLFADMRVSGRLPRVSANAALLKDYADWIHNTLMWNRADLGYYPSATLFMRPTDTYVTDEGYGIIAQYDFGSAVAVSSLGSLSQTNNNNYNVFPTIKTQNDNVVQALVGSTWQEVADCTADLSVASTTSEKVFVLPATVTAQKWRIVNKKGPANQVSTSYGWAQFCLNFYGQYASGTDFRPVPEIGHLVLVGGGTNAATSFTTTEGVNTINYSNNYATYGFSLTKDLAQAGTFDVFMSSLSFTPGIEINPPVIYATMRSVVGSPV